MNGHSGIEPMNASPPAGNPFSTRRTRPGAMRFRFDHGEDETTVVERLRALDWWAQIVGPHGSGKSTLVAALRPALAAAGRDVRLVGLHQGDRRLPISVEEWRRFTPATQLIVDGYEQLGPFARWRVARRCRRQGCGLLVTTHTDLGFTTLFTTDPCLDLAVALVRQLLPPGDDTIGDTDIEAAWRANGGNLREMLFALYDLFEQRRAGRP
ncbi:MAG TPA: hypothetical protein VHC22_00445 [Pirellulales bacterium]|nr:hypothetical protein [Pirellulales bacterium]